MTTSDFQHEVFMSPNLITLIRGAMAFVSIALFHAGSYASLAALILLIVALALDAVDGFVARRRRRASDAGAAFDIAADRIVESVFWIYFAAAGLVTFWIPVIVIARGALIIVCRRNIPQWATLTAIHLGLITTVFGLAYARKLSVPVLSLLSHWYPTLIFLFFFEEIGLTVHAIFPGWFDHYLINADYAAFGVHPTVWLEGFSNYWLNEYLQL